MNSAASESANHRSLLSRIAHDAMRARGLEPDFPQDALAELHALRGPADGAARDLRDLPWCSIDNDESRDLDQLSVALPPRDGVDRLLVAIADVDALVHAGGALDVHAQRNTTSVYTAAEVFPMLPERLSFDWTSLNQDEDRLALVVELGVDAAGNVVEHDVGTARVRNRARLAYHAVGEWLDGTAAAPPALLHIEGLDANLRLQDDVARRLSAFRHAHGALEFETIEPRPVWSDGTLHGLVPARRNRARDLIENLMIAANVAIASTLEQRGIASLRRIVRAPARWPRIVELAAAHGAALPAEPDALALATFLAAQRAKDPERFPDLSLSVVKLLGPGEYVVERPGEDGPGHFGLAVRDYTHSTAPNRRYADLVTHRLLKSSFAGAPSPYDAAALDALARHCTQREDDAGKVERQVRKSAAALLLEHRVGASFDGHVTGASPKGTWVRVTDPVVEGRVVRGAEGLDVGDRVRVTLVRVDVREGHIDFAR